MCIRDRPKSKGVRGKRLVMVEKSNTVLDKKIEDLKGAINEFHHRLSESERQARETEKEWMAAFYDKQQAVFKECESKLINIEQMFLTHN